MITEFEIKNYGVAKEVKGRLTPLHAFIGPNDSGKSTILRALVSAVELAGRGQPPASWPTRDSNVATSIRFQVSRASFEIAVGPSGTGAILVVDNQQYRMNAFWSARQLLRNSGRETLMVDDLRWLENRGAQLVRFDADSLRPPSNLIPEAEQIRFLNGRGVGLAAIYDGIRDRYEDAFKRISADVTRLFPAIKRLTLRAISSAQKVLEIELHDGSRIASAEMSEGLLYYLAFAALAVIKPAAMIAVEEPETGLHPSRITEVVKSLRNLSENGVQVIVATHSPLLVNELKPREVSIVTRDIEKGTLVREIADTPDFETRSKVYSLGELWLSYANGTDEEPLFRQTQ